MKQEKLFALVLIFEGGRDNKHKVLAIGNKAHCKAYRENIGLIELPHGAYSYRWEHWSLDHVRKAWDKLDIGLNALQDAFDIGVINS